MCSIGLIAGKHRSRPLRLRRLDGAIAAEVVLTQWAGSRQPMAELTTRIPLAGGDEWALTKQVHEWFERIARSAT